MRWRRTGHGRRFALILPAVMLVLAGAAGPGWAQEPPEVRFDDRVEVTEVLLDVVVTDAEGNVILGLGPADFAVEADGTPVAVDSVSFYSNRFLLGDPALDAAGPGAAPGAPGSAGEVGERPRPVTVDRSFVLVFERPPSALARDRTGALRLAQAARESVRWAVEELLPGDRVAVVALDGRVRLHHDFTRDRGRLATAIHRAASGKPPLERWPSRTPEPEPGMSLATTLADPEVAARAVDAYGALAVLGEALSGIAGRKNLLLVGADLPAPGSPEARRGYPAVVTALNGANVAVYTLGTTLAGRQESLAVLASDTGGRYAARVADFAQPLSRIARETSGYYLLSFSGKTLSGGGGDGYREVTVRTVNPEFSARTRRGFCAAGCSGGG